MYSRVVYARNILSREDFSLQKILVVPLVDVFIFFMVIFMGKLVKFCTD